MLKNITIGQFFPGESFIHRLDPRTKIILTIALIIGVFSSQGFLGFAFVLAFVLASAKSTGIGLKYLVKGLKGVFFIVIITFLLNLFLQQSGEVLVEIWVIRITTGGVRSAAYMAMRLIMLVISSQLMTLTTSPIMLTDGLESLMKPLTYLKFPAHEIAMMMSIALRFIPTLMEETDKIMKAQMARGADFESGNIMARAKAMIPLLVPLFVSAFRRADELAMAMEARCYRGGSGRTKMRQLKYGLNDLVAVLSVGVLIGLIVVLNIVGAP